MPPYSPLDLVNALTLFTEPQKEGPVRIFIVDDNRISEFYLAVLEHASKQAIALSDPIKVLEALSDFHPE